MPGTMGENVHKKVEVVGTSTKSVSDAISTAIDRASDSLDNLEWFEVTEIRGYIAEDEPEYQVGVKIGFQIE